MGKGLYGYPGMRTASRIGRPTRNLNSNLAEVRKRFGLKNGYIASKYKGDNRNSHRRYESSDPIASARDLFQKLGKAGIQHAIRDRKTNEVIGWTREMKGHDIITYRIRKSSDGSPVVDINIQNSHSNLKKQKIHFYKRGEK